MKRIYTKPTIEAVPLKMDSPLLAGSDKKGINATISGYQSSDNEHGDNGNEGEEDGFSQDLFNY